ncbi:helix-turn-helix domain-containing protein [Sphingomonas olei]
MTLPAFAEPFGDRLPTVDERRAADQLRRLIAQHATGDATLKVFDPDAHKPVEITLTRAMSDLLLDLLRQVGSGHAVTLLPIRELLTTQQAADLLNVSRPYLIGLLDKGVINHTFTGRHRRIRAEDVFAYKAKRDADRADALSDLAAGDADLL